jgi:ACR3 family arsenite transporter
MGKFERFLSLWVALCIIAGVLLGSLVPQLFVFIASLEWAHINFVMAALIWVMIYPMMVQIDFSRIKDVGRKPKGLALTLIINWLIKRFSMTALGWLFFKVIFASTVDPQSANEYIASMILLGVAPCTAMVFAWSQLTQGDPNNIFVQVSVNDVIMIFAFAPITAFLLGMSDISVPWETLLLSVLLYVVLALVAGVFTRCNLQSNHIQSFLAKAKPWSVVGLLGTVVLLFGFQAKTILVQPQAIVLIAIALLIQTYGIFVIAFVAALTIKLPKNVAASTCLIGTSNFLSSPLQ